VKAITLKQVTTVHVSRRLSFATTINIVLILNLIYRADLSPY
jgi:hypothetical protein